MLHFAVMLCAGCSDDTAAPDQPPVVEEPSIKALLARFATPATEVMVVSHRGDWQHAPENSLAAIQRCIDIGCDMVEIDLHMTGDEELVLMHDATLDRTTNGTGKVSQRQSRYIQSLYLKDKNGNLTTEKVPTLQQALALAKGKILIVLDKYDYYIPQVQAILGRTGMSSHVVLLGFNSLADTRTGFGSLLDSIHYIPSINKQTDNVGAYIDAFSTNLDPSAFAFWYDTDTSPIVGYMQQVKTAHRRVWVNTTEDKQCAGHTDAVSLADPDAGWGVVLRQGADIILTDYPVQMLQYLRQRKLHQ